MAFSQKQVLLVDNATTCAMRIKTLVNIHGAIAKIVHWSDWHHFMQLETPNDPCLIIIEETVPDHIIENIIHHFPIPPLFLLINKKSNAKSWRFTKPITPILSNLSNFEMMALLEPYWSEERSINLPTVLILDEIPETSFLLQKGLSAANIPCRISSRIDSASAEELDMLMVNITNLEKRKRQIKKVKSINSSIGVIVYGDKKSLTQLDFVQFAINTKIDLALTYEQLEQTWISDFYKVWREKAEYNDQQFVTQQVEASLSTLLEKSLVMQVLLASSMDGVISFDENGQILRFNSGFCELVGATKQQLVNDNLFNWLPLQAKLALKDLLSRDYFQQQQVLDIQIRHQHGINIPVSVAINEINFHGQYIFVAVMRNDTNQQLQQKLLSQRNAQLSHQTEELKSQKKLASELARKNQRKQYDFILKLINLLSKHKQSNRTQNVNISNILRYFRLISRQEQAIPEHLTINKTITDALKQQSANLEASMIEVDLNINSKLQTFFDPHHLSLVFSELIGNAIKFSVKGGKLKVTNSSPSENKIEIHIADFGVGILEHKQNHIFDIYELNSEQKEEVATGLPLVKALMHANKGDVSVDNHYSNGDVVGTVFKLELPIT